MLNEDLVLIFLECETHYSKKHIWCRSYQTSILLLLQLVTSSQNIPVLLPYVFFYFLIGQVDSIVEVSAPEDIVMGVK